MERYAVTLRDCAERANMPPVKELARQPRFSALYRVTVHHPDWRAVDVIVTVKRGDDITREAVYVGCFGNKPLLHAMPAEQYTAFTQKVMAARFDKLVDQEGIPRFGVDLCLFERASAGFYRSVVFCPQKAEGAYAYLLHAIQMHLPEALREIEQ